MPHVRLVENVDEKHGKDGLSFYRQAVADLSPEGEKGRHTRYRIKEWKPLYTRVVVLLQKGMTVSQIAQETEIGLTTRQLKLLLKDPMFRLKMTQYNRRLDTAIVERATEEMTKFPEVLLAKDRLASAAEDAANMLIELMNPRSTVWKGISIHERRMMASIAQDILDRAGLKSTVSTEEAGHGREYSPEEIQSALSNAKELEAITSRLDNRGSSFVLTHEERTGAEETVALDPTVATPTEGSTIETTAVEETPAFNDPRETTVFGNPTPENEGR